MNNETRQAAAFRLLKLELMTAALIGMTVATAATGSKMMMLAFDHYTSSVISFAFLCVGLVCMWVVVYCGTFALDLIPVTVRAYRVYAHRLRVDRIIVVLALLFCANAVIGQEKKEPLRILKNRKIYLEELQKIEEEKNAKVKKLTERYLKVLESVKVDYTKEGNLEAALAAKKEIEGLRPVLGKDEFEKLVEAPGRVSVTKVVLHSTTLNGAGSRSGVVIGLLAGKKVWEEKFKLSWKAGRNNKVELRLPEKTYMNVIKVLPDHDEGRNAGFSEIEIFSGKTNIAPLSTITTSKGVRSVTPRQLVDGDSTSDLNGTSWIGILGVKAWVEFHLPEK